MKVTHACVILSLFEVAHSSLTNVHVEGCIPGSLVCRGDRQYGLCNIGNIVSFMDTAEGTSCICSGPKCSIVLTTTSDTELPAHPSSQQDGSPDAPSATSTQVSSPTAPQNPDVPTATPSSDSSTSICKGNAVGTDAKSSSPLSNTGVSAPSSTSRPDTVPGAGTTGQGAGKPYIKTFLGDGEATSGWPAQAQWISFDDMWTTNLESVLLQSCTQFGQANNSPAESTDVKSAIENAAESSGVDKRFILAIALEESGCCVRAPTTNYGVTNPGMMQSHNGIHSCYNINPCPKETIRGMIADGVMGTSSGDGLAQILGKLGGSDVSRYYKAARMYNSGSIAPSGQLEDGVATHCYASNIANRLIGWSKGIPGCKIGGS